MTGEEFQSKYKLLEPLFDTGLRSYAGRDAAGAPVFVHVLPAAGEKGAAVDASRVLDLMQRLSEEDRAAVVDLLDVEGRWVVVTEADPRLRALVPWLEQAARRTEPRIDQPAVEPDVSVPEEMGELTRLFTPPHVESPAGEASPPTELPPEPRLREGAPVEPPSSTELPPEPPRPPTAWSEEPAGPGEFTRMFGAAARDEPPQASPEPPPREEAPVEPPSPTELPPEPPRPPTAWPEEPAGPPVAGEEVTPPAPPPPEGPGEFTRMFGAAPEGPVSEPATKAPGPSSSVPPTEPVIRWEEQREAGPPPSGESPAPPGEFTRMFGAPPQEPSPTPPPLGESRPPDLPPTEPVIRWKDVGPASVEEAPPPGEREGRPEPEEGPPTPGEFTRMFGPGSPETRGREGARGYDLGRPADPELGGGATGSFYGPADPDRGAPLGDPLFPERAEEPGLSPRDTHSYLDRLYAQEPEAGQPAPPPPPAPAGEPGGPVPAGPSDYTRIISGAGLSAPSTGPAPVPPAPAAPKKPSRARLVILVVAISLAVVGVISVILYFALRAPPAS